MTSALSTVVVFKSLDDGLNALIQAHPVSRCNRTPS